MFIRSKHMYNYIIAIKSNKCNTLSYLVVTTSIELNGFPPNELESAFIFIIDGLIWMVLSGSWDTEEMNSYTDFALRIELRELAATKSGEILCF